MELDIVNPAKHFDQSDVFDKFKVHDWKENLTIILKNKYFYLICKIFLRITDYNNYSIY